MKILKEQKRPMIIVLDFDGTIVENDFPSIGQLKPYAKEVINEFYDNGYQIIIWTCRANEYLEQCKNFLNKTGIKYHKINENSDYVEFDTGPKIFGDLYADDRGLGFEEVCLGSWLLIRQEIYKYFEKNQSELQEKFCNL